MSPPAGDWYRRKTPARLAAGAFALILIHPPSPISVAKTIEVEAEGDTVEAAVEAAVNGASRSVRNIRNVYVRDFKSVVENGSVSHYRVDTKITFLLDGSDAG